MAGRIQGITVEIGGDTTKLQTALKGVNTEIRNTQSQLRDVDKLLKLDPGNTELLAQKHRLLGDAVKETKEKLETLKTAAEQAEQALKDGTITQEQYDGLQREIVETEQKLKALEDELEHLKVVKRKEVAGKIKEAREQGDLSENAEYDAAKDEQRDIEARIEELEGILKNAEVVVEDEVDFDKINVGCTVKVFDVTFDEEMEFKIVGSTEANSLEGKISNESPVGQALIGKSVGDIVDVETQAGDIQYKVLDISRSL